MTNLLISKTFKYFYEIGYFLFPEAFKISQLLKKNVKLLLPFLNKTMILKVKINNKTKILLTFTELTSLLNQLIAKNYLKKFKKLSKNINLNMIHFMQG